MRLIEDKYSSKFNYKKLYSTSCCNVPMCNGDSYCQNCGKYFTDKQIAEMINTDSKFKTKAFFIGITVLVLCIIFLLLTKYYKNA